MAITNPFGSRTNANVLSQASSTNNFITQSLKIRFLNSFERDLDNEQIYLFYGQTTPWGADYESPLSTSDNIPTATNSFSDDIRARNGITALKKIKAADTNIAFRLYKWENGTVYNHYNTEVDQTITGNDNYYVVDNDIQSTAYGDVYKCLDNNGGSKSVINPFGTLSTAKNPVVTEDGYKWKYMFKIPGSLLSKFATLQDPRPDYVPFPSDDVGTLFKTDPGTIDRIDVTAAGSNYSPTRASNGTYFDGAYDTPVVPIFVDGNGARAESAKIVIGTDNNGAITSFDRDGFVSGTEQDYRYPTQGAYNKLNRWTPVRFIEDITANEDLNALSNVDVVDRTIATGIARISETTGVIDSPNDIKIVNGGTGYSAGQTVKIIQSSTLAYGVSLDSSGGINKVEVIPNREGKNHTVASLVPVIETTNAPSGFKATPIISPPEGHGGNPKRELNAKAFFITSKITGQTGEATGLDADFSRTNDFRQVGLIQNPFAFGSSELANPSPATTLTAKYQLSVLDQGSVFAGAIQTNQVEDAIIIGTFSRARGRIIDVFSQGAGQYAIRYTKLGSQDFTENDRIVSTIIGDKALKIPNNTIKQPEVDVYSGDILFINNNSPITRSSEQTETVNFLLTF